MQRFVDVIQLYAGSNRSAGLAGRSGARFHPTRSVTIVALSTAQRSMPVIPWGAE